MLSGFGGWPMFSAFNYFLDCEFVEDGKTIDLISVGIVCEDGREYYAINYNCDWSKADQWVWENVLDALPTRPTEKQWASKDCGEEWRSRKQIASDVAKFLGADPTYTPNAPATFALSESKPKPKIWGEWCAYDWVVLCQLWGKMIDLPKGFPMRCCDVIQTLEDELGINEEQWPRSLETPGNHNALLGAKTVQARWEFAKKMRTQQAFEKSRVRR